MTLFNSIDIRRSLKRLSLDLKVVVMAESFNIIFPIRDVVYFNLIDDFSECCTYLTLDTEEPGLKKIKELG